MRLAMRELYDGRLVEAESSSGLSPRHKKVLVLVFAVLLTVAAVIIAGQLV
jgi:ABC-type Fe3+-siderophore transport system permease subunit